MNSLQHDFVKKSFSLLICLFSIFYASAQPIYVKVNGTGNGSSWENASGDLKSILDTLNFNTEIWVAAGIYYPILCSDCNENDRLQSFRIPDGVKLFGGFNGDEVLRESRNWQGNPTVLNGDIDQDGTPTANSFSVIYTSNVSNNTVLDGFIIKNGTADFLGGNDKGPGRSGGGWFNESDDNSEPTIRNCIFENNYAIAFGGALYNKANEASSCQPLIRNSDFKSNQSEQGGGAIYNDADQNLANCSPQIFDCLFENNQSKYGGAVYNSGIRGIASPKIFNCSFFTNIVTFYGGACYNFGKNGGESKPIFINALFVENQASSAGAIYNLGDNGTAKPMILNATFYGNSANTGAAVYGNESNNGLTEINISNSIFWGNTAGFNSIFHMSGNGSPTINIDHSLFDASDCENITIHNPLHHFNCNGGLLFNVNPLFESPDAGNFRLKNMSPATDVGNNERLMLYNVHFDMDSLLRVHNDLVDLGAYEFGSFNYEAPTISLEPLDQEACVGTSIQFEIAAMGSGDFSYQWFKNGDSIGLNSNILNLDSATIEDTGTYNCQVTNFIGEVLASQEGSLLVESWKEATIELLVADTSLCESESFNFWVVPNYEDAIPIYQWLINGAEIGIQDSFLIMDNLQNGDLVSCSLTSSLNCVATNPILSNSIEIVVEECNTTSIKKEQKNQIFDVFPNPSSGQITFHFYDVEGLISINLIDINQRILKQEKLILPNQNSVQEFDFSDLPAGFYWVEIMKDKRKFIQQIVIFP